MGQKSTLKIDLKLPKPVVLVGMMGAGKTAVGRRLAAAIGLPFVDADEEIEKAPAMLEGKTEMDALVAYLQVLGTMATLDETKVYRE